MLVGVLPRWSIMSNKKDRSDWLWNAEQVHNLLEMCITCIYIYIYISRLTPFYADRSERVNALDFASIVAQDAVDGYVGRFEDDSLTERTTTDEYYDVATDFYLYGWGNSFHFATRFAGESLEDSIVRQVGEDFTYQLLPYPALEVVFQWWTLACRVGSPYSKIGKPRI